MATVKQRLAFKKVLKGVPVMQAMREVGYSPSTAATSTKLTGSDAWHELMDKHISDAALAKVHKEGLRATSVRFTPEGELIRVEDYATRHKYLESGYKIKGRMENPTEANKTLIVIIAGQSANRYGVSTAQEPGGSSE